MPGAAVAKPAVVAQAPAGSDGTDPFDFLESAAAPSSKPANSSTSLGRKASTAKNNKAISNVVIGVTVVVVAVCIIIAIRKFKNDAADERGDDRPAFTQFESTQPTSPFVTMANYMRIQTGMTESEVAEILGGPGVEVTSNTMGQGTAYEIQTKGMSWGGGGLGSVQVVFQKGKVVMKTQFGLR